MDEQLDTFPQSICQIYSFNECFLELYILEPPYLKKLSRLSFTESIRSIL
jgi:hypothetical protein